MIALIAIAVVLLAALGAPLFTVFGAASMALFAQHPEPGASASWAANDVFTERFADSPTMVTIPLFVFAGYLMAESGTPRRLVHLSRAWFGWLPGGLAIVCIGASAFFTTFTGGSGITIVAIGGLLFPALMQEKYSEKFSLGVVTAGGSLGLLFPPSLPLILYAIVAGVSIERLILAGFLPGVITLAVLSLYAMYIGRRLWRTEVAQRTPFVLSEALRALWSTKWEVLLPVVLVLGLFTGAMRIHEAAAFAAMYALIMEVFIYRDLSLARDVPRIIREATIMFGAILVILATAIGFTGYLIQAQVPARVLDAMTHILSGPIMFLLLLNLFLLVVGMLMDIFSAIVVVAPLIVPIATHPAIGIDPYHLGIVFLLNLEIGYLTPPVGLNLFISGFRFKKPITLLYRAVVPFVILLLVSLLITTYVPSLSTWLPGMRGNDEAQVPASASQGPDEDAEPMGGDDGDTLDDLMDDEDMDLDDLMDDP